jgi:hypothetical protein
LLLKGKWNLERGEGLREREKGRKIEREEKRVWKWERESEKKRRERGEWGERDVQRGKEIGIVKELEIERDRERERKIMGKL